MFNKVIFELFENMLLLIRPTCITIDFFNGNICIASMITGDTPKSTMWTSNWKCWRICRRLLSIKFIGKRLDKRNHNSFLYFVSRQLFNSFNLPSPNATAIASFSHTRTAHWHIWWPIPVFDVKWCRRSKRWDSWCCFLIYFCFCFLFLDLWNDLLHINIKVYSKHYIL